MIFLVSAGCLAVIVSAVINVAMFPGTLIIRAHPNAERLVMVAYVFIGGLVFLIYHIWKKRRKGRLTNQIQRTGR